MTDPEGLQRQSTRFLLLYSLAAAGGSVAYVPFLTILLPVRITALAGNDDVVWLAYITLGSALAASFGNIAFGWWSDRLHNRRKLIAAGAILSSVLLVAIGKAQGITALIALIMLWQLGLNMMLGPLAAWAGDYVPDNQKGLLGGLLAVSPAVGAMSGALVTLPGLASADMRLMLVALLVIAMVSPVLVFGRPREFPSLMRTASPIPAQDGQPERRHTAIIRMWLSRLLVQIAEATLFAYLLFWFRSINSEITDNRTASIFSIVLILAVPVALITGRWSDRSNRPILPLCVAAGVAAMGLVLMALSTSLPAAIASFVLFGLAAAIFLALHTSQTLRVLPDPAHRGRDLGLFNLTNTVPSLIMPGLTLVLVPNFGFPGLFMMLAGLALTASLLLASISQFGRHPTSRN